ncbi:hypothetical protein NHG35_04605 [Aerococcaceae bacterium NML180378]|nr:hypothetical protein [Aerococcaceae bacterium NML180378]
MKFKRFVRSISAILLVAQHVATVPVNMYYAQDELEQSSYEIVTENEDTATETSDSVEFEASEQPDILSHDTQLESEGEQLETDSEQQSEEDEEELSHSAEAPKQMRLADLLSNVELLRLDRSYEKHPINLTGERLEMDTQFIVRYTFKLPEGETLKAGDILLRDGFRGNNYPTGDIRFQNSDGLRGLVYWDSNPMALYYDVDGDTFYAEMTTTLLTAGVKLGGELRFTTFDQEIQILAEGPGDAEITTYAWQEGKPGDVPEAIIQLFNKSQEDVALNAHSKYLNWVVEITPKEPAVNVPELRVEPVGAHLLEQDTVRVANANGEMSKLGYVGYRTIGLHDTELGRKLTEKRYLLFRTKVTEHEKDTVYRVVNILRSNHVNLLKTSHAMSISLDSEEGNHSPQDVQADAFIKDFAIWQSGVQVPFGSKLNLEEQILLRYALEIPDGVVLNDGDRLIVSVPPEISIDFDYRGKLIINDAEGNKVATVSGKYGQEKLIFELTDYFSENPYRRYMNIDVIADIAHIHNNDRLDITYPNHQGRYMLEYVAYGSQRNEMIEKYIAPPERIAVSLLPNSINLDDEGTVSHEENPTLFFNSYVYKPIVNWVAYINPQALEIGDVTITDLVGEGHELLPQTIVVYRGFDGYGDTVEDAKIVERANGFDITIPDVNYPIKVNYSTEVEDQSQGEFHNSISIETELKGNSIARAMSRIDRGGEAGNKVEPVDIPVKAIKKLDGRDLVANEFEFELLDKETRQQLAVATNNAEGIVQFTDVQADQAGTYHYIIRERSVESQTMHYDDSEHEISAVVRQEGKVLVLDSITSPPTFTNTYRPLPTEYTIQATKQLTGRELVDGEFTFELVSKDNSQTKHTATNTAQGAITFAAIPATSAGTYTYTLRELSGDQPTLTYDQTEHTITVVVKDNNGQLEVESMTPAPTFTNTYRPLPTEYTIQATKQLTGRELVDGEFTFELVLKDNSQTKHTATNTAQGAITFAAIPATSASTYTYTLRELSGDQPTLTYDQTEHTITVVVKDNNGQLEVESMTPAPTFTNTYRPLPTEYMIRAKSVLEGKQQEAGQFTFELWDDKNKKLGTTTNDASGNITFENVEINEVGNRVFTIKEIIQPSPTITHLTESEEVALSIEDKNGQLVATPAKNEVPVFYHRYKPLPVEHIVEAHVRVDGCMLEGEALTYELVDNTGSVVRTVTSDKNIIRFEPIRFEEVTTKRYTLRQVAGSDSQVTYATNQPEITFTVVDNDGQLTVTQKNREELSFVNVYQSKPIEQVIQAKVTFTGADAMSTFDFVMINEKSEVVATAQNNAEGNIVFNPIQFAKQGDYHFEIKQVIGDNDKIIYDRTTHAINVKVDETACKLEATLVPASPIIFENELVPTPPHSSDESTSNSSSESEPPQSSDESTSSSSSDPEPPHSSDESTSSNSSESEPPHSIDESSSNSSSESEPPHSSDESTSSSDSEPPRSHKKLPKTGENPTLLLWMSITLIGMANIYAKVARKRN